MNRLPKPSFFDDHAALIALSKNKRVSSYPHLQQHVSAIRSGYTQYVNASGNACGIAPVDLPARVKEFLLKHYGAPPKDIEYISQIRRESGVGTCPMCGSIHSGTLDHLLPKIDFPCFAVFGMNLVPACKCNNLRNTALTGPNSGERILHPYFDDVLASRILAACIKDIGPVPKISLRVLVDPTHPQFPAVTFHIANIVERTGVTQYLAKLWTKLIRRPSLVAMEMRHIPQSRAELVEIIERELERNDEIHESKNNWNSIFLYGLLQDDVVDWLYHKLSAPGRLPDAPLLDW